MKTKAIFILCLFSLSAVSVGTARIEAPTEFFRICIDGDGQRKPEYVRVTDGRIALTDVKPSSDWKDRKDARPDRWYVLGTKIKASKGGGYLAYAPSGKDHRVFLSREAGEGTDWKIGDRKEGEHNFCYGVIQAVSGKVKGWYLDVEEFEDKDKDGRIFWRLVLRKDVARTKVHITQIYSYRSTAR